MTNPWNYQDRFWSVADVSVVVSEVVEPSAAAAGTASSTWWLGAIGGEERRSIFVKKCH